MAHVVHRYDPPERFIAGTVGEPGSRTFFLQARSGPRITSVALEKEQVAILAERLDAMLDEVLRTSGGEASVPAVAPAGLHDKDPLEQPIVEEFRVGSMTLAWEPDEQRVVLEMFSVTEGVEDEDSDDDSAVDPAAELAAALEGEIDEDDIAAAIEDQGQQADEALVVRLSSAQARAFAKRALDVVAAGRPSCPFCGRPLDPEGHLCPRANGFRRVPDA